MCMHKASSILHVELGGDEIQLNVELSTYLSQCNQDSNFINNPHKVNEPFQIAETFHIENSI